MSGALRTKAYRERLKSGRAVYFIEADSVALAETLAANGFLPASDIDNHAAICRALRAVIEFWIAQELQNENAK
jgi:hypothetical protein